jgi:hypothetical protein
MSMLSRSMEVALIEISQATCKLRKDYPWTRDIIRVLWEVDTNVLFGTLACRLGELREASGLPMPIKFEATVQSILYNHTSQSVE